MELERVFRNDYAPLNRGFKFTIGDKATVLAVRKPEIDILVNDKSYTLGYRNFIIITKRRN